MISVHNKGNDLSNETVQKEALERKDAISHKVGSYNDPLVYHSLNKVENIRYVYNYNHKLNFKYIKELPGLRTKILIAGEVLS